MRAAVLGEIFWSVLVCIYYVFVAAINNLIPSTRSRKDIKGDIVLITGGGSGIGRLLAQKLSQLGAIIVTVDVNKNGNDETVRSIVKAGGEAHSYICDLSDREEIYKTAKKISDDIGIVTILVNNAGIVSGSDLLQTKDEKIELTYKVNVLSHFWTIKSFLPNMIVQKKGHIVNMASLAAHMGIPKLIDYCSSKAAAAMLDESLRHELVRQGHNEYVKTTVICPYFINTGMFDGVQSKVIPILDPDYVAERTKDAILTNEEVVVLPRWIAALMALKCFLPVKSQMALGKAFGADMCMDDFSGRK